MTSNSKGSFFINFSITNEVGDDLSVFVLNFLPEVSTLPSLVAISFLKVEI